VTAGQRRSNIPPLLWSVKLCGLVDTTLSLLKKTWCPYPRDVQWLLCESKLTVHFMLHLGQLLQLKPSPTPQLVVLLQTDQVGLQEKLLFLIYPHCPILLSALTTHRTRQTVLTFTFQMISSHILLLSLLAYTVLAVPLVNTPVKTTVFTQKICTTYHTTKSVKPSTAIHLKTITLHPTIRVTYTPSTTVTPKASTGQLNTSNYTLKLPIDWLLFAVASTTTSIVTVTKSVVTDTFTLILTTTAIASTTCKSIPSWILEKFLAHVD